MTDSRATLGTVFDDSRKACFGDTQPQTLRPIIAAVSGGATRAGLWGSAVLRQIEIERAKQSGAGGAALLRVSSVSGGSLGAAGAMALFSVQPEPCHTREALAPLRAKDNRVTCPSRRRRARPAACARRDMRAAACRSSWRRSLASTTCAAVTQRHCCAKRTTRCASPAFASCISTCHRAGRKTFRSTGSCQTRLRGPFGTTPSQSRPARIRSLTTLSNSTGCAAR